jgi:transposase-like protein
MGKQAEIREAWRERVVDQERSGVSIRTYCKERDLCEHSFFSWRRRLRMDGPVRFALVENKAVSAEPTTLELVLSEGEKLRIPCEESALRLVLQVLRRQR